MKIINHGVYHEHKVRIRCEECECLYEVSEENDAYAYEKPIKILVGSIEYSWTEKRKFYTICPECNHKNPITDREYEIIGRRINDTETINGK